MYTTAWAFPIRLGDSCGTPQWHQGLCCVELWTAILGSCAHVRCREYCNLSVDESGSHNMLSQVQCAFASWEDGVDTGMPDWSGKSMKQLIESTWRTNIAGLIAQSDVFDRILAAATEVMQTSRGKKRGTHHKMSRDPKNEAVVSLFGPNPAVQRDESEPLPSDNGNFAANSDHQAETDHYSAYSGIGESGDDAKDDWGADEQADCDDEAEHRSEVLAEDDEYEDYTEDVEYEDEDYGDGNGEAFEDAM